MAQGKKNEPTVEPSEADYWYAAGFVDGEGCITVRASTAVKGHPEWNPSMYASVTISQVDPRPLQWMQARWGGALRPLKRRGGSRGLNERDAWEWCIVGSQAYHFIDGIRAMLKVKPEQAANALRLRDQRATRARGQTGWRRPLSAEEIALQAEIRTEATRLNQRGRSWPELPEI
jgi:hypothetical protein